MYSIPKNDTAVRQVLSDAIDDPHGSSEYRNALTVLIATLDGRYEFQNQEYRQAINAVANEISSALPGTPEACHALAVLSTWSGRIPASPPPRLLGWTSTVFGRKPQSLKILGKPAAAWARSRAEALERMADDTRRKATSRRYAMSEDTLSRIVQLEGEAECWWRGVAKLDPDNVYRIAKPERIELMEKQQAKRKAEVEETESERDGVMKQEALAKCGGDIEAAAALLLNQANELDRWVSRVEQSGNRVERLHLHDNAAIAYRSRRVAGQLKEEDRRRRKQRSRELNR